MKLRAGNGSARASGPTAKIISLARVPAGSA